MLEVDATRSSVLRNSVFLFILKLFEWFELRYKWIQLITYNIFGNLNFVIHFFLSFYIIDIFLGREYDMKDEYCATRVARLDFSFERNGQQQKRICR